MRALFFYLSAKNWPCHKSETERYFGRLFGVVIAVVVPVVVPVVIVAVVVADVVVAVVVCRHGLDSTVMMYLPAKEYPGRV